MCIEDRGSASEASFWQCVTPTDGVVQDVAGSLHQRRWLVDEPLKDGAPLVLPGDDEGSYDGEPMLSRQLTSMSIESQDASSTDKEEELLEDLLPVLDSLEKALELPDQSDDAKAVLEGIEISLRMFRETLERGGVVVVDPLGEPFDPSKHEALAMVPNEEVEPNSVIEVVQKGYLLNERVVRAARVVVSAAS